MISKLNSKLSITDLHRIVPDLAEKYEAASNALGDIHHKVDLHIIELQKLKAKLATARGIETRAWNRMIEAANKTVED